MLTISGLYGEPSQIELEGDAYVTDAAVTIDYINTRYYIDRERSPFE
jgi:hypothetical protein